MERVDIEKLSNRVIGIAIEVHKILGPGFTENIYQRALSYELSENKIKFDKEKVVKIKYKGLLLGDQRIDFLVENELLLEIKSVSEINDIHIAQALSYLKALNKKLALILNFAKNRLEIKRVIN